MGAKYKKVTYSKDSYDIIENDCEILKEYKRNLFFIKNEHFKYFIEKKSSRLMVEFFGPSTCVFFNEVKKLKDWNFKGNQNDFKLNIWSKIGWMIFILKDEIIHVDFEKIDWKYEEWKKYHNFYLEKEKHINDLIASAEKENVFSKSLEKEINYLRKTEDPNDFYWDCEIIGHEIDKEIDKKYEWEREVSLAEQRAVDSVGFYGELDDY